MLIYGVNRPHRVNILILKVVSDIWKFRSLFTICYKIWYVIVRYIIWNHMIEMMLCYICVITKSCNTISNYHFLFYIILIYGILFYIALPYNSFIDLKLLWYGRQSQTTVSYTIMNIRCHMNNMENMRGHLTISTKLNTGYCCFYSVLFCKTIYHDTTSPADHSINISLVNRLFEKKIQFTIYRARLFSAIYQERVRVQWLYKNMFS